MSNLKDELDTDPLSRGYSGMTDEQVSASLNTADRTRSVASVPSTDIYDALDPAEYAAASASEKSMLSDIFSLPDVRMQGNTFTVLLSVFRDGSTSRDNLEALASLSTSRAVELSLGRVKVGHVQEVRR